MNSDRPLRRAAMAWFLLGCLLFFNGFMAASSVKHAVHHANHQAGTHSSGFCAWVCAAAEGIATALPGVDPAFQLADQSAYGLIDQCECLAPSLISSRGPPAVIS